VAQPGSLDAPSSPAASSRDPVLGLLLKWTLPLQASVGSKLRIAARADAATDERVTSRAPGPKVRQSARLGSVSRAKALTPNELDHTQVDAADTVILAAHTRVSSVARLMTLVWDPPPKSMRKNQDRSTRRSKKWPLVLGPFENVEPDFKRRLWSSLF
jgi:hypothetical protein